MKKMGFFVALLLLKFFASAQGGNLSIGANVPSTKLDVNGAVTYREAPSIAVTDTSVAVAYLTHSQFRLTGGVAPFTITGPTSSAPAMNLVSGARMVLVNHTAYTGKLNGFVLSPGQAVEFVYSNGQWNSIASGVDLSNAIDDGHFKNLSALLAKKDCKNGGLYITAGYYTAGDGGGAKYYFDSASTALVDSASVLKPSSISGAGRLIALFDDKVSPKFFGAKANGNFDDTRAIQKAVDYSILHKKTLLFSSPDVDYNSYVITNTIEIIPPLGQSQAFLNIESQGNTSLQLQYRGPSNKAVFHVLGLKSSKISGVGISIKNGASNVVGWDVATTNDYGSTSFVTFDNCSVGMEAGANNVGWRMGHISTDPSADISEYVWLNCIVSGSNQPGQTGYLVEGGNTVGLKWYGGYGFNLDKLYSNAGTSGATYGSGNGGVYFYGLGGHECNTYFTIANIETYYISGGRFEGGKRFLSVGSSSNHPSVVCSGVHIAALNPTDGHLFYLDSPCTLLLDGCVITQGAYNAQMIVGAGFQNKGNIQVRGGAITATEPFYTADATKWKVYITGVGKSDGFGTPDYFSDRNPSIQELSGRILALEQKK